MKLEGISVSDTLKKAEELIESEQDLSPAMKAMMNMLLLIVRLLMNRLGMNSENSSKSPAQDPNRKKGSKAPKADKTPGGQQGRIGKQLEQVADPDAIQTLMLDKRTLPHGQLKKTVKMRH